MGGKDTQRLADAFALVPELAAGCRHVALRRAT